MVRDIVHYWSQIVFIVSCISLLCVYNSIIDLFRAGYQGLKSEVWQLIPRWSSGSVVWLMIIGLRFDSPHILIWKKIISFDKFSKRNMKISKTTLSPKRVRKKISHPAPPFWQLNHANSAYFGAISVNFPQFWHSSLSFCKSWIPPCTCNIRYTWRLCKCSLTFVLPVGVIFSASNFIVGDYSLFRNTQRQQKPPNFYWEWGNNFF